MSDPFSEQAAGLPSPDSYRMPAPQRPRPVSKRQWNRRGWRGRYVWVQVASVVVFSVAMNLSLHVSAWWSLLSGAALAVILVNLFGYYARRNRGDFDDEFRP